MKICFLLPVYGISGGNFTVYEHAKRLTQKGHEVLVAFESGACAVRVTSYPGMEMIPTRLLREISPDEPFDVAFATWWETAYSVRRIRATHYCYLVQGFEENFYEPAETEQRQLVRESYEANVHLFTVSYALRDYLREEFGRHAT